MTSHATPRTDDEPAMLTASQVADFLQVSRPTLYRLIGRGDFPAPCKLGGCSRWPRSDVLAFIDAQCAQRDAGTP